MAAYITAELHRELRQSEIITNLYQFTYDVGTREAVQTLHTYAILLSQDCDLLWDFEAKIANRPRDLNGVLVYEVESVVDIRPRLPGGDILRRIRRHGEERYHFLDAVPANLDSLGQGLPELVIDFRRFYTLPADEIYRQFAADGPNSAKRRCRLDGPYREHLQIRAAYYFQRVTLPTLDEV